MIKRLPVLLKINDNIYNEVEIKKPGGKLLADTEEAKKKNIYLALRNFVSGCITVIKGTNDITDVISIKSAVGKMSIKSAEYLSQEIMSLYYNGEDYIEGYYECPRCGEEIIAEKTVMDGIEIDTRDRISDLKVGFMKDDNELLFDIDFENTIPLQSENGVEEVNNVTMTFPTVEHFIEVENEIGLSNAVKVQYAVYAKAIVRVNGAEVDKKWKRVKGVMLFNESGEIRHDIGEITKYLNQYGVDNRVEKTCKKCGKVWQPVINTSNFFDSAPL